MSENGAASGKVIDEAVLSAMVLVTSQGGMLIEIHADRKDATHLGGQIEKSCSERHAKRSASPISV